MSRRAALAIALLASAALSAADVAPPENQRVFICAHSFMTFIAKLLPPMARAGGVGFESAGHQMIGGSQVIQHWNKPDDKAKPALEAGRVDTLFLSPTVQMPDAGIDNYVRLGVAKNPRLRVLVQASWPAYDDPGSASIEAFQRRAKAFRNAERDQATVESLARLRAGQAGGWSKLLAAQVARLNAAIGHEAVTVVPVNEAVFDLRTRIADGSMPALKKQTDLFSDDIGHPTPVLTVLVAYCHFAALYGRSPVGLPVPAGFPGGRQAEAVNRTLQEIAWKAVGQKTAAAKAGS